MTTQLFKMLPYVIKIIDKKQYNTAAVIFSNLKKKCNAVVIKTHLNLQICSVIRNNLYCIQSRL